MERENKQTKIIAQHKNLYINFAHYVQPTKNMDMRSQLFLYILWDVKAQNTPTD